MVEVSGGRTIHTTRSGNEVRAALEISAGEVHLQAYPVFSISSLQCDGTRYTYEEHLVARDGTEIARRWTIEVSPHYDWPGEHEAEVWRAIEHIIELRARRGILENPFWTSFAEIRRHMPAKGKGGSDWRRIRRSLAVLKNTGVESSFFYRKGEGARRETSFDIIDDYDLGIKHDPHGDPVLRADGEPVMDRVQIRISNYIWENIAKRYVRPIDRGYRAQLKRWSSRRLYEVLAARFFARRKGDGSVKLRYSQVCGLLGCKRQRYLSLAKRMLSRYHAELIDADPPFLAAVKWHAVVGESDDWMLTYTPGPKARAEWDRQHWQLPEFEPELLFLEADADIALEDEPAWIDNPANVRVTVALDRDDDRKFQTAARQIFAELTGTRRRWDQKDRGLLVSLRQESVTLADIEAGIRACIDHRDELAAGRQRTLFGGWRSTASSATTTMNPVRTLPYCEAHIWEAHQQRP